MGFKEEIERRRTFGIISHPDAGKTTLTEKLLLFGGAIHVAGAVKSNKIKKTATSDFMEIERQRGVQRNQDQYSGYPGSPGLCRRHFPNLNGLRQCNHRDRCSQRSRNANP